MALVAVMRQDRERVEPPANALASGCLGPRPAASSTDGESSEREAHDIEAPAWPVPGSRRSERRDGVPKDGQEDLGPEHADETPQQECLANESSDRFVSLRGPAITEIDSPNLRGGHRKS